MYTCDRRCNTLKIIWVIFKNDMDSYYKTWCFFLNGLEKMGMLLNVAFNNNFVIS